MLRASIVNAQGSKISNFCDLCYIHYLRESVADWQAKKWLKVMEHCPTLSGPYSLHVLENYENTVHVFIRVHLILQFGLNKERKQETIPGNTSAVASTETSTTTTTTVTPDIRNCGDNRAVAGCFQLLERNRTYSQATVSQVQAQLSRSVRGIVFKSLSIPFSPNIIFPTTILSTVTK